jgi:hypothetical protein
MRSASSCIVIVGAAGGVVGVTLARNALRSYQKSNKILA